MSGDVLGWWSLGGEKRKSGGNGRAMNMKWMESQFVAAYRAIKRLS